MASDKNSPTAEQLRNAIDSGRTGDKVPAPDPSLVPITADDEAAGTPPSSGAVARAYATESSRPHHEPQQGGPGHAWILIGFVLILAIVIIAAGVTLKHAG